MKFFVSGKVGLEEHAKVVMKALEDAGHEITLDWTGIENLKPYDQNRMASLDAAVRESRAVRDADVLVIVADRNGVGMYVELGIAIGSGIPVRIITDDESRSVFVHHPLVKKVHDIADVIEEFA